ncbi:MAG TPA: indolepyruvate oxidoreductase subunit beta [Dehalococcoidia bacterium]|jgi:indolepyruvate ferredoxin oxidoreductase beta subunit|nr:indolepyruvate oxidoreductase subunit beta [Dehalococcoidia bacterium]
MKLDVFIAGVGGQGNLFASRVLAVYSLGKGYTVLATETIGAAQRGGSVVSHLRISDAEIYSPLIPVGQVDILMGFETIEMLRNINLLSPQGEYLLNKYQIPTVRCNMGLDTYPSDEAIMEALQATGKRGYVIEATEAAWRVGDSVLTNVVMLGALCEISPFFDSDEVKRVLAAEAPRKAVDSNLRAFEAGKALMAEVVGKR